MARWQAAVAAALLCLLPSLDGRAAVGCEAALRQAAARYGVPNDLLVALGRVESGLHPYAVNAGGRPFIGADAASAMAFVERARRDGIDLIDVGCGQINLYWHPDAFESLEAAFDSTRNADYAARFLAELHARHGNWPAAVAHYHSSRPSAQSRYLGQISARLKPEDRALLAEFPDLVESLEGWNRSSAIAVYRALAAHAGDAGAETAAPADTDAGAADAAAAPRPRVVSPAARTRGSSPEEERPGPRIVRVARH